jgi:hypothetical protein
MRITAIRRNMSLSTYALASMLVGAALAFVPNMKAAEYVCIPGYPLNCNQAGCSWSMTQNTYICNLFKISEGPPCPTDHGCRDSHLD